MAPRNIYFGLVRETTFFARNEQLLSNLFLLQAESNKGLSKQHKKPSTITFSQSPLFA